MVYAGIVAGGSGLRMGADKPKQFLEVKGKPIIIHTLLRFLSVDGIDRVIVAVNPDWLGEMQELIERFIPQPVKQRITLIKGGADRNASVMNIVEAIRKSTALSDEDILLTHDGVRPFVSTETIKENISAAAEFGACTTAVPATDTLLYSEDGITVTDTPERSKLFCAQTPQSFKITALLEAYSSLDDSQKQNLTDVCGIFSAAGKDVRIVKGSPENIKITSPLDLRLAELLV